jgi:hypothetical protein
MPAATTHVEFARDVYNALPENMQNQIPDLPMYFLGSQGPDLFFFHRLSVLPGSLAKLGSRMHREHIRETISFMYHDCRENPHLYSYYQGFLTHYALDSLCHPLIEWYAHVEHEQTGIFEGEAHFTYEGDLDQYVLNQKHHSYNVSHDLTVSKEDSRLIGQMYHELFEAVFHTEVPAKTIAEAPGQCSAATSLLKPSSQKYSFVFHAESLLHQPHMVSGMMLWNKSDHPSVLNLDHETFEVPGYPDTRDNRSFPQLYQDAASFAVKLISGIQDDDFKRDFLGRCIPR